MDSVLLDHFQPKLNFSMEFDNFVVKTASSHDDLKRALQLRHKVFLEEHLDHNTETGMDSDDYDYQADHLMIIESNSKQAIGVYRLIHSDFSNTFYSQNEFFLDHFLQLDGAKLELGRACTHASFRTGRTMDLLWQGLSHYINKTKTRFLFGCSSIPSTDPKFVFSIFKSLKKKNHVEFGLNIHPTEKYSFENSEAFLETAKEDGNILRNLPPLLRSYLHAGSKIHGLPALDKSFHCSDMFTILDLKLLNKKFQERYRCPIH